MICLFILIICKQEVPDAPSLCDGEKHAGYYREITLLDQQVGRLRRELKQVGISHKGKTQRKEALIFCNTIQRLVGADEHFVAADGWGCAEV